MVALQPATELINGRLINRGMRAVRKGLTQLFALFNLHLNAMTRMAFEFAYAKTKISYAKKLVCIHSIRQYFQIKECKFYNFWNSRTARNYPATGCNNAVNLQAENLMWLLIFLLYLKSQIEREIYMIFSYCQSNLVVKAIDNLLISMFFCIRIVIIT